MKNLCKIIIALVCILSVLCVFMACKKDNQPQTTESSSTQTSGEETSSTAIEETSSEETSSEESSSGGFAEGANRNEILGPGWTDWYPSDFESK